MPKRLPHEKYYELRTAISKVAPECFSKFTDKQLADSYAKEIGHPISASTIQGLRTNVFKINDPPRGKLVRLEKCITELMVILRGQGVLNELEETRLICILKDELELEE